MRFLLFSLVALVSYSASSATVVSQFTSENDGDLTAPSFGSVTISDDVADQLIFDVMVNTTVLGTGSDVHQFGFMLDFGGPLSLFSGTNNPTILPDKKVSGRNSTFDWVVDFGAGQPFFDSVSFIVQGTGLDLSAITNAGISSQNNKPDAQFMAHIQSTSTLGGSESIGGLNIPLPAVAWLFPAGLIAGLGWMRRRSKFA